MIDNKYGRVMIDNCPSDEPCFVLRAQDIFAIPVLRFYKMLTAHLPGFHSSGIDQTIEKFNAWPKRKIPDTTADQYKL